MAKINHLEMTENLMTLNDIEVRRVSWVGASSLFTSQPTVC